MLSYIVFLLISLNINRSANACLLPDHPQHGLWSLVTGTNSPYISPGFEVSPGTALSVQCQSGYELEGVSFIICTGKVWSAEIGKCQNRCPAITSTVTTKVTCSHPNDKNILGNCTNASDRTIARFACAQFYESAEINKNPLLVCRNGVWSDPIPRCSAVCGVKSVSADPLIIGGSIGNTTDYPWHVAVYQVNPGIDNSGDFKYLCGGTLINERVILTAAHCVVPRGGSGTPLKDLWVGAGKFYMKPLDIRDTGEQLGEVEHVFTADGYRPIRNSDFFADIAILVMEKPFVLSKYVLPVCIDWGLKYENLFTGGKVNGTIVGWGFTKEGQDVSNELRELQMPYYPYDRCSKGLPQNYDYYFTNDKLCAGYINSSKSVCNGDAGGGLVFRNTDGRYYLVGILTLGPNSPQGFCDSQQIALYTKISSYTTSFILEKEREYRPESLITHFNTETVYLSDPLVVISESKQLCGLKSIKSETLIVGGRNTTKGEYPWQIAIYDTTKNNQLICGGSLIHQRIILTAAHCVTDQDSNKQNPADQFLLAAGKYYREYEDPRDTFVQYSKVREIFVPPQYDGDKQNYMADIAVIISTEKFTLSKFIQPICIDWDNKYENKLIHSPTKGFVSGWGNTVESGKLSEVLKDIEVPYIDRHECKKQLPLDYDIYLTFDKICSGYINKSVNVCKGDSGGGLVFRIPGTDRYYIAGIVSLSPRAPTVLGGCDSQQYALYTRVSHYITSFILSTVRLFL